MGGIRFVIGRPRGSSGSAIQSILFDAREWTEAAARSWLDRKGFKVRNLDKARGVLRYRQREKGDFDPRSFRSIETGRREHVTMASNPTRKKRAAPAKRRRVKKPKAKAKTTRTTVKSVKVMRSNARRKPKRQKNARQRAASRPSSRYTIALSPSAARAFAKVARLSKSRRREMLRGLRRHPSGGVYVALPTWHGSREQAVRLADRARLVLAYDAGRRRRSIGVGSIPRVVAVP